MYRQRIGIRFDGTPAHWLGVTIMALALAVLPLIDWIGGMSWTETRIPLIAPGTTAALSVGVLLLSADRARYILLALPLLWLAATGLHAWILNIPQDYALGAAAVIAAIACVVPSLKKHR